MTQFKRRAFPLLMTAISVFAATGANWRIT
jgi:hypothetical protein